MDLSQQSVSVPEPADVAIEEVKMPNVVKPVVDLEDLKARKPKMTEHTQSLEVFGDGVSAIAKMAGIQFRASDP